MPLELTPFGLLLELLLLLLVLVVVSVAEFILTEYRCHRLSTGHLLSQADCQFVHLHKQTGTLLCQTQALRSSLEQTEFLWLPPAGGKVIGRLDPAANLIGSISALIFPFTKYQKEALLSEKSASALAKLF